jgi:hypothetical protein
MPGIAAEAATLAVVDVDQQTASVGAIEGADRAVDKERL